MFKFELYYILLLHYCNQDFFFPFIFFSFLWEISEVFLCLIKII